MSKEIKVMVDDIRNFEVKSKIVEDKEGEREIVTVVKFEVSKPAGEFDNIQLALAGRHQVDIMMASPQMAMDF